MEYKDKSLNIYRILLIGVLIYIYFNSENLFFVLDNIAFFGVSIYWLFNKNSTKGLKIVSVILITVAVFSIVITPIFGGIISNKMDEFKNGLNGLEFNK